MFGIGQGQFRKMKIRLDFLFFQCFHFLHTIQLLLPSLCHFGLSPGNIFPDELFGPFNFFLLGRILPDVVLP